MCQQNHCPTFFRKGRNTVESIVTNKEEFARWMEEWLHRIPKGGVLDFPPGKPTSVVSQARGSQNEPTASTDEHERFQAGCKKPQQTNATCPERSRRSLP